MNERMLISAVRPHEVRGAIVDAQGKLETYELEVADAGLLRGNIYVGQVANTEPSLNAAFVDFGAPKQGFLPVGDVCPEAYHQPPKSEGRVKINEVLRRRRKILVQVVKDAIGNKGAALTTEIALAGRYAVLTPFDGSTGISRKIEEEAERKRLKQIITSLELPDDIGLIVRTPAANMSEAEISADVHYLVDQWQAILKRSKDRRTKSGTCLHEDNDLVVRMIRDQFQSHCEQVLIDTEAAYKTAVEYFERTMPERLEVLKLWDRPDGLFSYHGIESQIAQIYERRIGLPSGGYLIIEPTEALLVIDVNSGKSTSQSSQAETAYTTNLEAAEELARQLRLRDLGGLVVVDFIDMANRRHNRDVEKQLKSALKADKARTYVGSISENGLLEINRQRIKQAIRLQTHGKCPTCGGSGLVRGARFAAVSILRRIEERAVKGQLRDVHVELHPDLANELQNGYRAEIHELEQRFAIRIVVQGRASLRLSDEQIVWNEAPALDAADSAQDSARRETRRQPSGDGERDGDSTKASGSNGSSGRRRRRRRRRSNGRRRPDEQSASPSDPPKAAGDAEPAANKDSDKADDAEKAEAQPDAGSHGDASGPPEEPPQKKRRRRRSRGGRGRKRSTDASKKAAADSPPESSESPAPAADSQPAPPAGEASPDGTGGGSSGRRRRRRRRRPKADAPASSDSSESDQAA